jgi:hypothetical protein
MSENADGYYGEPDGTDEELDLSFLDEDGEEKGAERGDS